MSEHQQNHWELRWPVILQQLWLVGELAWKAGRILEAALQMPTTEPGALFLEHFERTSFFFVWVHVVTACFICKMHPLVLSCLLRSLAARWRKKGKR
jgi:hypothetical protein